MSKIRDYILIVFLVLIIFLMPVRNNINNLFHRKKSELKEKQIIGNVSQTHTGIDTSLEQESALTVKDTHLEEIKDDLTKKAKIQDEVLSFRLKSKDRVKQIQSALKKANFFKGEIDGKIGPQTKRAIKVFQKSKDLNPDGVVGQKTWEELNKFLKD